VHQLSWFEIHLVCHGTTGRTFTALKAKIGVLPTEGFNFRPKYHFDLPKTYPVMQAERQAAVHAPVFIVENMDAG
jgi:hypothetical protein